MAKRLAGEIRRSDRRSTRSAGGARGALAFVRLLALRCAPVRCDPCLRALEDSGSPAYGNKPGLPAAEQRPFCCLKFKGKL